jgi:hypothetical protein
VNCRGFETVRGGQTGADRAALAEHIADFAQSHNVRTHIVAGPGARDQLLINLYVYDAMATRRDNPGGFFHSCGRAPASGDSENVLVRTRRAPTLAARETRAAKFRFTPGGPTT